MPVHSDSNPDDATPLSPREKHILASIEDAQWRRDPEFALRMATPAAGPGQARTVDRHGTAVTAILLLLVLATVLPPTWRAVLGLVLTLGVLPWLLLRRLERGTS
jgi:Flp pilus assembly protein TadB